MTRGAGEANQKRVRRILIAEDDIVSRKMLAHALRASGYEVTAASTGDEAWDIIEVGRAPKLLILDWLMPGRNGLDICRELQSRNLPQPYYIILLTSKSEKSDVIEGLEAGANDYVVKPFDVDELNARVRVGFRVVELQERLAEEVVKLQEALNHIQTLQGLLPICMHCHKIRDDGGYWQQLEGYIETNSQAEFSHGICPECMDTYYATIREQLKEKRAADAARVQAEAKEA